jgi:hypothetical protein
MKLSNIAFQPAQVAVPKTPAQNQTSQGSVVAQDKSEIGCSGLDTALTKPTLVQEAPSRFGQKAVGAIAGTLVGIMAGHAGPAAVALAAGVGAAAVTVAAAGPIFKQSLDSANTGNLIHDLTAVCGTLAAGAMLVATTAGATGALAYPLATIGTYAAPLLGGAVGATVGGYFGLD